MKTTTFFHSDLEKLVQTGRSIATEHAEVKDGYLYFEHFNEQYRTPWPPFPNTPAILKGFCTCEEVGPITRDRSGDYLGPPGDPKKYMAIVEEARRRKKDTA